MLRQLVGKPLDRAEQPRGEAALAGRAPVLAGAAVRRPAHRRVGGRHDADALVAGLPGVPRNGSFNLKYFP